MSYMISDVIKGPVQNRCKSTGKIFNLGIIPLSTRAYDIYLLRNNKTMYKEK